MALVSRRDPSYVLPESPEAYAPALQNLVQLAPAAQDETMAYMALNDFWFFMRFVLSTGDYKCDDEDSPHYGKNWYDHPWLFARCRDLQARPNNRLHLWPRFHFKSTTIAFGLTLWDLANNPELRFAIVTYKIEGAGSEFLNRIKQELEANPRLPRLFPWAFYPDPKVESPTWTRFRLTVRRETNPVESSITSFGLVGSQAVGMHFDCLIYDDIVSKESVATQAAINVCTQAWRESSALGADTIRSRYAGTRWAMHDTYSEILRSGVVDVDHQAPFDDAGEPVLRSRTWMEHQRAQMSAHVFACQILNEPMAEGKQHFEHEWICWYDEDPEKIREVCNCFLLMDPASSRKKDTDPDYTAIAVVGVASGVPRTKYFLLDLYRDRLSLIETTDLLFGLVQKWQPSCCLVEQIGANRDVEHFRHVMNERGLHFRIHPFYEATYPGRIKAERIKRLQGPMSRGDWSFPRKGLFHAYDGKPAVDMMQVLWTEEMQYWTPIGGARHDDMLDVLSWVHSKEASTIVVPPRHIDGEEALKIAGYDKARSIGRKNTRRSAWAI